MTANRVVLRQRFAHRLPGGRPVIAAVVVAQVKVTAGLVHRHTVETQTQETAVRARFVKAVATGVVGNHGAVLSGAEVIAPRLRRVWPGDNVFFGIVVEVSVLHVNPLSISMKP